MTKDTDALREAEALRSALKNLLDACYQADGRENLSEEIDGSLLDDAAAALELQYPVIWTDDQVAMLRMRQTDRSTHPYTCGGDRTDPAHMFHAEDEGEEPGLLYPTVRGWKCPACDYRQFWSHETGGPALATPASDVAPVAWLYEIAGSGVWRLYKTRYTSPQQVAEGWTETPLYAHPPHPAPVDSDEAVRLLRGIVRLSEMGFDASMREPEEDGNYAVYTRAKAFLDGHPSSVALSEALRDIPDEVYRHIAESKDVGNARSRVADLVAQLPLTTPVDPVAGGEALREVAAKYADMGIDERAEAMADNCDGDPWELIGYFREKLRQSQARVDAANNAATGFAKKLAALKGPAA